jgi:preprotein translocase subunit SecF
MDIIGKRKIWYLVSAAVLIPGAILLSTAGLKLGIDFTGGSVVTVATDRPQEDIRQIIREQGVAEPTITSTSDGYQARFTDDVRVEAALSDAEGVTVRRFEQVGPSISQDLAVNSLISLAAVSLAITLYVAFSFRKVPHPMRFGAMAIVALLHDALFVLGLFSLLGVLMGVEIDAFIVTAVLTVIGFSVHDTIVVFDRLRENLLRRSGSFPDIVNTSVNEVMGRSLNTSITTVLVLLALLLFGGSATVTFVLALLLGMISGTYSSIFIAAPLLVTWHNSRDGGDKAPPQT